MKISLNKINEERRRKGKPPLTASQAEKIAKQSRDDGGDAIVATMLATNDCGGGDGGCD